MGILNLTPDSFFPASRFDSTDPGKLVDLATEMVDAGAGIIDLGAESTRPGAENLDEHTELARLMPALAAIRAAVAVPISIDTRKSNVARAALDAGADIINDVSAMRDDPKMLKLIADFDCPIIIMHMQGNPKTMQAAPYYSDVVQDVRSFLFEHIQIARSAGIRHIIVDPGIGFGKRQNDNLAILSAIGDFQSLDCPVMVGHSRKGFIGSCLAYSADGVSIKPRPAEDRLAGSLAVALWCASRKVSMVRVHDVAATADAFRMTRILEEFSTSNALGPGDIHA